MTVYVRLRQSAAAVVVFVLALAINDVEWKLSSALWLWIFAILCVWCIASVHDIRETLADHIGIAYDNKHVSLVVWALIFLAPITLVVLTTQLLFYLSWTRLIAGSFQSLNDVIVE